MMMDTWLWNALKVFIVQVAYSVYICFSLNIVVKEWSCRITQGRIQGAPLVRTP